MTPLRQASTMLVTCFTVCAVWSLLAQASIERNLRALRLLARVDPNSAGTSAVLSEALAVTGFRPPRGMDPRGFTSPREAPPQATGGPWDPWDRAPVSVPVAVRCHPLTT